MKKKYLTGPRILAALVVLVIAATVFFALRTPAVEIELGTVTRGPMTVTVDDEGETRVRNLYIVSAPIAGELLRVELKPGDRVVAGTLLARIMPAQPGPLDARTLAQIESNIRALDAQLAAAGERVAQADAGRVRAEREYRRIAELAGRGFASQAALDMARMEQERSRASATEARRSVEAARHSAKAAQAALVVAQSGRAGRGAVTVTAPVTGYVLRVPQESERVVAAGTTIAEIGDPALLEIVTDLLSADAVQVRPGAPVRIEAWGGEKPLLGRVRLVEPYGFTKISALGVEEQRVNTVIDFAQPRAAWERLGHGYRTTVRIEVWSVRDVLRAPIGALFRSGNRWMAFVVDADERARLTPVEVGRMNDEMAEVRGGLAVGARVILHPGDRAADGVRVRAADRTD